MIFSAKLSRYLVLFTIVVVASIFFPKFYSMLFDKAISGPRVNYSSISNSFVIIRPSYSDFVMEDQYGNILKREEFEKLTPLLSYRQLLYRDEMPDSIKGVPIDIQNLRLNSIVFKINSEAIHKYTIPLNPLIESNPVRPD